MKQLHARLMLLSMLCALSACGSVFAPATDSKPEAANNSSKPKPVNSTTISSTEADCNVQADNKLKLFDRPDTYPISAEERSNARSALFDECMKGNRTQIAGVYKSDTQASMDTASLASLSPAAGGYPPSPPAGIAASSYPGSTVVMVNGNTASQLASLSPSAGGTVSTTTAGAYPGATVVVVNSPTATPAPRPVPVMPQALAKPIAVQAEKPVTVASTTTTAVTTPQTPAPQQQLYAQPPTYKSVPASSVNAPDAAAQQLERILSQ